MGFPGIKFNYRVVPGWGKQTLEPGVNPGSDSPRMNIKGVAVDSEDRVYLVNRGSPSSVIILDKNGILLGSMGQRIINDPHSICIDSHNNIFVVDRETHVVMEFDTNSEVTLTLGTMNSPSQEQSGIPFNHPTGVAISSDKDIYVSDGYGNSNIHKYTSTGSLSLSWGGKGIHPGQFNTPHGICIDTEDRVYVADRQNNRVQAFDCEGNYIKEWKDLIGASDVAVDHDNNLYVSELEGRRVSVLSYEGSVLSRLNEDNQGKQFLAPHGISVDSNGNVYISGVGNGKRVLKFIRT